MIAAAPQGAKSTTIVTVTYNSSNVLPDMLESVPDDIPVIIVDNNSVDASRIAEISEAHATQLVRNEANVGFGQACNQGARLASSELVMFLNPDARLTEGSLECLEFAALKYPNASAFSPSLESPGGRFVLNPATSIEYRGWRLPKGRPWMDREIPFISGAAALVRKSAFDTIGGFDPNIFLFYDRFTIRR